MRILYVCGQINSAGGVQRVAIDKANYFCAQPGYDVGILTSPSRATSPHFPIDARVKIFVAPEAERSKSWTRLSLLQRVRAVFRYRKFARNVLREFQPDIVVHSGGYEIIYMWHLYGDKKWICEFHFARDDGKYLPRRSRFEMLVRKFVSKLMDLLRTRADLFVVLTKEDLQAWISSGLKFKRITQVYNSVELPCFRSDAERKKRIIAVGRLDFQKRFEDLIEIWAKLEKRFPEWEVDIFGEGSDKELLEEKIKENNLSRIFLRGRSSRIVEEMFSSSVFVMTSAFEGQPIVLLEAMSCALPCVTFDFKCGPRDMISDGETGFIVENRDANIFAEKLALLMTDEELRKKMGNAGEKKARGQYSQQEIMNQWKEIYQNLNQSKK